MDLGDASAKAGVLCAILVRSRLATATVRDEKSQRGWLLEDVHA
jgi:hypothetical protein